MNIYFSSQCESYKTQMYTEYTLHCTEQNVDIIMS